jgi:adenylate kinase family enzyme
LNPFICQAIKDAMTYPSNDGRPPYKGILLDGFPRCEEQMKTFQEWPFESELPLVSCTPVGYTRECR